MFEFTLFFNYITGALSVAFTAFGVGISDALASVGALEASFIQPGPNKDINKINIIGLAIIETAAVIGLILSVMLIFGKTEGITNDFYCGISKIGIIFAICLPGLFISIFASQPIVYSTLALARQPLFFQKILNILILNLSFIQTPIIFGFIVSLIINFRSYDCSTFAGACALIGSGIALGLGSIGPAFGISLFAKSVSSAIGYNREAYNKLFVFTFISETLIETPIVFAIVTSLILISYSSIETDSFTLAIAYLAAGFCNGFGNLGPGIGSGKASASACEQIAKNPEMYPVLSKTSLIIQGLIDSSAIYAWVVAILMILSAR